jgi:hypothetical protein
VALATAWASPSAIGATDEPPVPAPAVGESPFPAPALAGDFPDPDVTLVDGVHYAIATSGGWAPVFPILRSTDLREWEHAGAVLRRAPRWAREDFWAPELAELPSGRFAVYYSAWPKRPRGAGRPRGGSRYCLGVATAPSPLGPWRDRGTPLRCTRSGAIDPTPVVDGERLWLVHKADANSLDRPTPILAQRLSADGLRLIGPARRLIRNRAPWERRVVEGPELLWREGWWHMIYSGALCCGPKCDYAVGAARARTLIGPWRKHPGNPILRGGRGWRCPGHVSLLDGQVAFHAYRRGHPLEGRQMQLAPLTFDASGWPEIGDGRPARLAPGAGSLAFEDDFAGRSLAREWQWPVAAPPRVRVDDGLTLQAPRRAGARPDAGVLVRKIGGDRFVATAVASRAALRGRASAGLALTRGGPFGVGSQAIGIAVDRRGATVWSRGDRGLRRHARVAGPRTALVHLRLVADGRRVRFGVSADGERWRNSRRLRAPVVETARVGLTAGGRRGAVARFVRAALVER